MKSNSFEQRHLFKTGALLMLFLWGGHLNLTAQIKVTGKVTAEHKPLVGVTVMEEGTTNGTTTDIRGKYTISVSGSSSTLKYSFIGFNEKTTVVGNQTVIDVTLTESVEAIDEIVVVGYGTMRKQDLTGSSVSIKNEALRDIPVTTAAQAISGKAAGVSIVTQNGAPGADINILVRGGTSITQSSEPLYIVDGFQMENGLQNIDINDIASIDIMKDASATAIYGARGSNGVVLITTKSAQMGKTEVSYNTYFSFEKLGSKIDVLGVEDYVKYQYEFQTLAGNESSWAEMFGGGDPANESFYTGAYSYIESEYGNRKGIDWQDEVFGGTSLTQNHNLSVTGGNDKTKVLLSYNYTGQDGILDKYGYKKNSIRAKINHELWKNIHIDFNTNYHATEVDGGGSLGGKLKMTILQPPTGGTLYTNEEMIASDISEDMQLIDSQYDIYNPLIENDAVDNESFTRFLTSNLGLNIKFLNDFTFRTAGSYLWKQARQDYWDDGRTATAKNNGGPYGYRKNSEKYSWQITHTLSWKHYFGPHYLNAMLGQETRYSESISIKNEYHDFPENNFGLDDISMGTSYSYSSGKSRGGMVSVFGRMMYDYQNRYLLTATLRADGTSKFARGHQWGYFPSVSGAWRISHEPFMTHVEALNDLKIRIGYGTSGNCSVSNNMYATDYQTGHYAIDGSDYSTLVPGNTVGNEDLKWETLTSENLGIDVALFRNRIGLTLDFYNNKSDNLIIKNKIPTSTGYSYQYQNIGAIQNRGIEIVLNTVNLAKSNFRWETNFNISFNRSKVLNIYNDAEEDYFIKTQSSRVSFMVEEGKPLGQFYGYIYNGVYTTDDFTQNTDGSYTLNNNVASLKGQTRSSIKPGDVKYICTADQTDDDGYPVWSTDDRTVIGNAEPKFTGGLTNTFTFKNFDLSIFMSFSYGNELFNMSSQRFIGPYLPNQNSLGVMRDRFVLIDPETGKETTSLDRLAALNPQQYDNEAMWSLHSDNKIAITDALSYYIEDGSYLKIKNITLGYTLPEKLLGKAHIQSLRIYCTLNNVFTFTQYSGYDPEVSATSSLLTRGIDNSSYPYSKGWLLGLNLKF